MKNLFRKIFYGSLLFVSMTPFTACVDTISVGDSFLEKQPGVDIDKDYVFSKAEYARYFLWNNYSYLYSAWKYHMNGGQIDALSDCYHSFLQWDIPYRNYYNGTYNASIESNMGGDDRCRPGFGDSAYKVWSTVRACWIFIENVDRVPDMPEEEKARLKAEAKIIIASRYFDIFMNLGGLPIVTHSYESTDTFEEPRATVDETVKFMVKLLDEAIAEPNLPWNIPANELENWAGRLTKASASGLKCKILLYAASPLFNNAEPYTDEAPQEAVQQHLVWYGGYKPELWTQCLEACEEFFRLNGQYGNYYKLIQPAGTTEEDYRKAFYTAYHNRGTTENLFEVHYYRTLYEWDKQVPGNTTHYGATAPTLDYMEMFPNADGTPFDGQKVYNTDNPENIDIFENRDPRLYETLLVQKKGFMYQGKQVDLCQNSKSTLYGSGAVGGAFNWNKNSIAAHGIGSYKWVLDYKTMGNDPVQWPYMRMAEMHLIYAEALAENARLAEACNEVNKVRARVGLGKIELCNPTLNLTSNKENLIKEILRERACEFGLEAVRLYDMVRRKCISDFTKHLRGIKIYRKDAEAETVDIDQVTKYPSFRYETYEITASPVRVWWTPGYWTNKWLLTAFPMTEVNKGYGLIQNTGW